MMYADTVKFILENNINTEFEGLSPVKTFSGGLVIST